MAHAYASEVNFGNKTTLRGTEVRTLAQISLERSESLVVFAFAKLQNAVPGTMCLLTLTWGHGGESISCDYELVHRMQVALAASTVRVEGRLVDASGGNNNLSSTQASISCVIGIGNVGGQTMQSTRWLHQRGNHGVLASEPTRLMCLEGFNIGSDTYLMLFDQPPPDRPGAAIDASIVRHVRGGMPFQISRPNSQAFRAGVYWLANSNPTLLDVDPQAQLWVEAEILL